MGICVFVSNIVSLQHSCWRDVDKLPLYHLCYYSRIMKYKVTKIPSNIFSFIDNNNNWQWGFLIIICSKDVLT